jgi:septum formation protein
METLKSLDRPMTILLATSSPRRIETLRGLGVPFIAHAAEIDESLLDHLPIPARVVELAERKAHAGLKSYQASACAGIDPDFIIGADTLVSINGAALGKAGSKEEARAMLCALSGKTHTVSTGLCVIASGTGHAEKIHSETSVRFKSLSKKEIEWYLDTGEWQGAAGAYRIQEHASYFVERMEGSFSGVVGLPLHEFYAILCRLGYQFPTGSRSNAMP